MANNYNDSDIFTAFTVGLLFGVLLAVIAFIGIDSARMNAEAEAGYQRSIILLDSMLNGQ